MGTSLPPAERVEVEANADLVAAAGPELSATLGVAFRRLGRAVALACAALPGSRELNRLVGVSTTEQLDAAEAFYRERGSDFYVSLMPGTGLEGELERRGYAADYAWMKFTRATADPPPAQTDLGVELVDAGRAADFGETAAAGYGLPASFGPWLARLAGRAGWWCFVSYHGGMPVGTGALYVSGDAGWLSLGATLPEARGRGSQTAILARRIELAAELGCSIVITETGERVPDRPSRSYRNIVRAGFQEAYLRPNYRAPETAWRNGR